MFVAASAWLLVTPALAHPGASEHLHATRDVECDITVILGRIRILVEEHRLEEARRELGRATTCGAPAAELATARSSIRSANGDLPGALAVLDAAVELEPRAAVVRITRAGVLGDLGRHGEAGADLLAAAALLRRPSPQLWLQAARHLEQAGDSSGAVKALDRGLEVCGPVATLSRLAARLEASTDIDAALTRLERLGSDIETLVLRAEILEENGRVEEARSTIANALSVLSDARDTPARRAREESLRTHLTHLTTVEAP